MRRLIFALVCVMGVANALVPSAWRSRSSRATSYLIRASPSSSFSDSESLAKMTVVEMKSLLRTRGLAVSGLKSELQDRLAKSLAEEDRATAASSDPASSSSSSSSSSSASTRAERRSALYGAPPPRQQPSTSSSLRPSAAAPSFLDFDDSVFDQARAATRGLERREQRSRQEFSREGSAVGPISPRTSAPARYASSRVASPLNDAETLEAGRRFRRGQAVSVTIERYGPLGASVSVRAAPGATLLQDEDEENEEEEDGDDDDGDSDDDDDDDEDGEEDYEEEEEENEEEDRGRQRQPEPVGRGLVLQQDIVYYRATFGSEPRIGDAVDGFVESVRCVICVCMLVCFCLANLSFTFLFPASRPHRTHAHTDLPPIHTQARRQDQHLPAPRGLRQD